jgi:hypothetical protein
MARDVKNLKSLTETLGVYRTLGEKISEEDDLNIEYRPYGNTTTANKEAAALMDDDKMEPLIDAGIEQTLEVVTKWDLTLDGVPVPLTLEGILEAEVPQQVFKDIGEAIAKAAKRGMGKKPGKGRLRAL